MKLTVKQMYMYAPFGLHGEFLGKPDIVTDISFESGIISSMNNGNCLVKDFKPYLRNILDITKEEFTHISENEIDGESLEAWANLDAQSRLGSKFSHEFWEGLYRYKFDLFDHVKNKRAIDYIHCKY